jgi:hypothetical protein
MFGESDTLKRSDTTAVTRLLNLFPDAGHQSSPNNGGLPAIILIIIPRPYFKLPSAG